MNVIRSIDRNSYSWHLVVFALGWDFVRATEPVGIVAVVVDDVLGGMRLELFLLGLREPLLLVPRVAGAAFGDARVFRRHRTVRGRVGEFVRRAHVAAVHAAEALVLQHEGRFGYVEFDCASLRGPVTAVPQTR